MMEQMGIIRGIYELELGIHPAQKMAGWEPLICDCDGEVEGVGRIRSQPLPWGSRERE